MKNDLLPLMDDLFNVPAGTTQISDCLGDLAEWDSLAVLSFIALADEKFGVEVTPFALSRCQTVGDLLDVLSASSASR